MDLTSRYQYDVGDNEISVVFVGDAHFSHVSPKSRIDDYPNTCITKLAKVRNVCQQRGFTKVVFLGDVFHRPQQPVTFLNKLFIEFEKFRAAGIDVFSVTGNHELKFDRLESVWDSALGTMYLSGLIKPFSMISLGSNKGTVNVYEYPYYPSPVLEQEFRNNDTHTH